MNSHEYTHTFTADTAYTGAGYAAVALLDAQAAGVPA